jgi:hypothetical protein
MYLTKNNVNKLYTPLAMNLILIEHGAGILDGEDYFLPIFTIISESVRLDI